MSRWRLPLPVFAPNDSELFLVNVLLKSLTMVALESMGPDATPEEAHRLLLKLVARGHRNLVESRVGMSEDGIEDFLEHLKKELS